METLATSSTLHQIAVARSFAAKLDGALPLLFGTTIFTSACLLFLVQPLISKMILPWFGGSAAIWITAMLFFQSCLLVGYLYAHFLTRFVDPRLQVAIHVAMLLCSLVFLPLSPNSHWLPKPGEDPTFAVFLVLGSSIGLPYTLLSATTPLIQKWFSLRNQSALPYRYFALSNTGSLLALFAFPVLVEPRLTSHQQSYLWSGAFLLFAVLCITSALLHLQHRPLVVRSEDLRINSGELRPSLRLIVLWTALAAAASALLLMVTNLLTQNIAPMPLLWVVPLGIYLITFILCFDSEFWYRRWFFLALVLPALAYTARATHRVEDQKLFELVPLLIGALFVVCMACHGELSRLKPAPARLTSFYLALSIGGAIGGVAIALLAPHFLRANYEYPAVLGITAFVLLSTIWGERKTWLRPRLYLGIWLAAAACCILLPFYAVQQLRNNQLEATYMARNFFGPLRIDEFRDQNNRSVRQLNHGTITHGTQFLDPQFRHIATTYYGRESGAGLTWRILEQAGPLKMGVVGLGTGTLAAYGRAGDTIRFYDINPLVIDIAKSRFSYITDSPAHVDISIGDARLSLEKQQSQGFDVLVVDAFSGDAIPVHLLTEEAFRLYWKHLKPDGVLVVHVSNRYLNLAPIVAAGVENSGRQVRLVSNSDDDENGVFQSDYVLITNRPGFFENSLLKGETRPITLRPGTRKWTDGYSNIWQALHFDG